MILVVDDDKRIAATLETTLRAEGHEVETAANGVEAYRLLNTLACRCVLLDLNMPQLDGMELLSIMERDGITTPTIVITGRQDIDEPVLRRFPNVCGFLRKPADVAELLEAVRRCVDRKADVVILSGGGWRITGHLAVDAAGEPADVLSGPAPFIRLTDAEVCGLDGRMTLSSPVLHVNRRRIEVFALETQTPEGGAAASEEVDACD